MEAMGQGDAGGDRGTDKDHLAGPSPVEVKAPESSRGTRQENFGGVGGVLDVGAVCVEARPPSVVNVLESSPVAVANPAKRPDVAANGGYSRGSRD